MRNRNIACLLAAAAVVAAGPKPPKVAPDDLPTVSKVEKMVKLEPFSRVIFELDDQGRLFLEGRPQTLNEFDKTVLRYTEQRGIHLRRTPGKSGVEKLNEDLKASPVHVILRVHKDAPWRHVQWMRMLLQEQRAHKAEFLVRDKRGREGVLPAWLTLGKAVDDAMEFLADDEEEAEKAPLDQPGTVAVTLLAEGEATRSFGGKTVRVPAKVTYAVGKTRVASLTDLKNAVSSGLAAARRATKEPRVEIRAAGRIPYGEVLTVLDLLRKHERIDFGGTEIPTRVERMAKTLPHPK